MPRRAEPNVQESELIARVVGVPTISEAPRVHIAWSRDTGKLSVWVSGIGYLREPEIRKLASYLLAKGSA